MLQALPADIAIDPATTPSAFHTPETASLLRYLDENKEYSTATRAMVSEYWLPSELWAMVFQIIAEEADSLPADNLASVRLTCKIFEKLATPFLLPQPRIICGPLSNSLARLTTVSQHPVFSRSIAEVVYVCSRYQFIKTSLEYKEALYRQRSWGKIEEPMSEQENRNLETAFSQHHQAYIDQITMENTGEVIACLCSALMRMPHVEKITISPNFDCYLDSNHFTGYFLEPDLVYNEAFLLMARVMSLANAQIQVLDIERKDHHYGDDTGINGALFRGMSNMDLIHCCRAFRGLRNIMIIAGATDIDGWMTGHLAKILSGATDLEELCVDGCSSNFQISMNNILGNTVWSRLAALNLIYVTLDQGDFLHLLRRHAGTMKDMHLLGVCLTNGSWRDFLEGMKSSLALQHISIAYPSEEEGHVFYLNQNALQDYILGDGPHPLSE